MCVPHVQHVQHYFFSSFSQSYHLCSGRCRRPCLLGSLREHDVDGSENFFWKCNLAFLQSFLNYSKSLRLQSVFYPGIKLKPALQKLEGKIESLSSYAHVVHDDDGNKNIPNLEIRQWKTAGLASIMSWTFQNRSCPLGDEKLAVFPLCGQREQLTTNFQFCFLICEALMPI